MQNHSAHALPGCFYPVTRAAACRADWRLIQPGRSVGYARAASTTAVPTQKWRVVVARLGAPDALHEGEVDATNWMGALRAARQNMGERPSLPPGASCSVDSHGVATVLDGASRRKFVLAPLSARATTSAAQPDANATTAQPQGLTPPSAPTAVSAPPAQVPAPVVAAPEPTAALPAAPTATPPQVVEERPEPAASTKKKFHTVGFTDGMIALGPTVAVGAPPVPPPVPPPRAAPPAALPPAPSRAPKADAPLESLLERDEDPTAQNPLFYRERAYLLPAGGTVSSAEAALRFKLAELQQALADKARGKLVNLAVFDHRWSDAPERPPVVVLRWRDWRNDVEVDYPAAARPSLSPSSSVPPSSDRLADVFEALEGLTQLRTAVEGLDFIVRLLERMIPAEATSACLYDINTDEMRFVALSGTGAAQMQGQAVARTAGLFGQAVRAEHACSVFPDVAVEPAFNPKVDSRSGLDPHNALLRPVVREHELFGMLQLVNRQGDLVFSAQDVSVINYIAERLAEFLHLARRRTRSSS